jgi:hypothetical protein
MAELKGTTITSGLRLLQRRLSAAREDAVTAATTNPRVLQRWRLTTAESFLPSPTFEARAVRALAEPQGAARLYCIDRRDGQARAAVRFRTSAYRERAIVIEEFALARMPLDPDEPDPDATTAAVLLLDRLHHYALAEELSPDLWLQSCHGATHEQLGSLGFLHASGGNGGRIYRRRGTGEHAGPALELMRANRRFKRRFE